MTLLANIEVFEPLTLEERGRCEELVEIIIVGEVASLRAGKALREVRDRHLYRETHTSLEAWALETCRVKRSRVYQLIEFADVQEAAAEQGVEVSNERLARALGMAAPEDWAVVMAAGQQAFQKQNLSSREVHGAAETVRMMAAGHIEHPETGEPVPWSTIPQEQQVNAVVTTMQRHSKALKDFQGTDDQKPMDYVAGLQQMGTAGALRFDPAGYWLEVMDASTGELLEGPKVKSIWDAPRAWRKQHESELQEDVELGVEPV